jgi:predicted nucleotidyltransferase component of viral defense system
VRPLRTRIEAARDRADTTWEVIERDYLISWILAGIANTEALSGTLAFKGGTALKKCYFGDYRFSEDLDFTGMNAPVGDALDAAIDEACATATRLLDPWAPVDISWERYGEKQPHPGGQEAFIVRARLPWQRGSKTPVRVEITVDEPVLWPTDMRGVLHAYEEPIDAQLCVYALEEIVAEKLRSILQYARHAQERGWARSRARDYYDLWRILTAHAEGLDRARFGDRLAQKCDVRGVAFESPDDFFDPAVLADVERSWQPFMAPLVPVLPSLDNVLEHLQPAVRDLLAKV